MKELDPKTPRMAFYGDKVPFNDGANTTVRRGRKWFDKLWAGGVRGHELVLLDGAGQVVGTARVEKLSFCRLVDVSREDILLYHDPARRDFQALLTRLEEAYPGISLQDYVTVVTFEVDQ